MATPGPIRPTDDEARRLGRGILQQARFASLGTRAPDGGHPHVTRIAISLIDQRLITLISDLATHSKALKHDPVCGLLLGEPGPKGDPLTHPRISLTCRARFLADKSMRDAYLKVNPKARLYVDFADFRFAQFDVSGAELNGGFGKAFHLNAADLDLKTE